MIILNTEPISVNNLYTGRRFLTKQGKATKTAMAWEIKKMWKQKPVKGEVGVEIKFYLKDNRKDLDNLLKATLDILTGVIWEDDRQITSINCSKQVDKQKPRIEMEIHDICKLTCLNCGNPTTTSSRCEKCTPRKLD